MTPAPGAARGRHAWDHGSWLTGDVMVRLRWRGHRDEGGADAGTRDDGLPPATNGTSPAGWARPAGGGRAQVPGWLQQSAGWAGRLLVVGVVIYLAFRLASALRIVVLPFIAALLLTALLQPLTRRLRRAGLPALAATWCTLLVAGAGPGGGGRAGGPPDAGALPAPRPRRRGDPPYPARVVLGRPPS